MTAALATPPGLGRPLPAIAWELHRDHRRAPATAVAYLGGQELDRLTGRGRLLHLRIALSTRRLTRLVEAAYTRTSR